MKSPFIRNGFKGFIGYIKTLLNISARVLKTILIMEVRFKKKSINLAPINMVEIRIKPKKIKNMEL